MPQQHQPAVSVRLVLRPADEPEGRRRRARARNRHPEGIKQHRVGRRLSRVGDAASAAERVLVCEFGGRTPSFRESRRVGRRAVLENRARNPGSVADIGERSRRVVLADPKSQPVVGEGVGT